MIHVLVLVGFLNTSNSRTLVFGKGKSPKMVKIIHVLYINPYLEEVLQGVTKIFLKTTPEKVSDEGRLLLLPPFVCSLSTFIADVFMSGFVMI